MGVPQKRSKTESTRLTTCLKPLSTIQYKVDPYILADEKSNVFKDTFVLTFSFPLQTMQIEEEIKVISTADFIGYTGGALSLFIGFSCFDYFSRLMDKLYQRFLTRSPGGDRVRNFWYNFSYIFQASRSS